MRQKSEKFGGRSHVNRFSFCRISSWSFSVVLIIDCRFVAIVCRMVVVENRFVAAVVKMNTKVQTLGVFLGIDRSMSWKQRCYVSVSYVSM